MNTFSRPLAVLLFWFGTWLPLLGQAPASLNNGVAAVVNNEAITMLEVLRQTGMEEDDLKQQMQQGKISDEERKQRIRQRRDRKSTRLNSSHVSESRMPSSA